MVLEVVSVSHLQVWEISENQNWWLKRIKSGLSDHSATRNQKRIHTPQLRIHSVVRAQRSIHSVDEFTTSPHALTLYDPPTVKEHCCCSAVALPSLLQLPAVHTASCLASWNVEASSAFQGICTPVHASKCETAMKPRPERAKNQMRF